MGICLWPVPSFAPWLGEAGVFVSHRTKSAFEHGGLCLDTRLLRQMQQRGIAKVATGDPAGGPIRE